MPCSSLVYPQTIRQRGGHLERLRGLGVHFGTHYWVTDRCDLQTDKWAESAGIQVIRYGNDDGSHKELVELLDLLRHASSEDTIAPPIVPDATEPLAADLPDPDTLEGMDVPTVRGMHKPRAANILSSKDEKRYEEYASFLFEYDAAIHRVWFVSLRPPRNELLGYTIFHKVASGAFGTIYRARQGDKIVAGKILHEAIREDPERLQSFRRGVRSMRILQSHKLPGIVPYIEAREIPAFVVMEFIEGENLAEVVSLRRVREWSTVLLVSRSVARIIQHSHSLPEQVLHRDIRPANIMITNVWELPENWEILVLDFDLSWHRGA